MLFISMVAMAATPKMEQYVDHTRHGAPGSRKSADFELLSAFHTACCIALFARPMSKPKRLQTSCLAASTLRNATRI